MNMELKIVAQAGTGALLISVEPNSTPGMRP
jgi:hypothetical protein